MGFNGLGHLAFVLHDKWTRHCTNHAVEAKRFLELRGLGRAKDLFKVGGEADIAACEPEDRLPIISHAEK